MLFDQRITKSKLLSRHCIIHQRAIGAKGGCGLR